MSTAEQLPSRALEELVRAHDALCDEVHALMRQSGASDFAASAVALAQRIINLRQSANDLHPGVISANQLATIGTSCSDMVLHLTQKVLAMAPQAPQAPTPGAMSAELAEFIRLSSNATETAEPPTARDSAHTSPNTKEPEAPNATDPPPRVRVIPYMIFDTNTSRILGISVIPVVEGASHASESVRKLASAYRKNIRLISLDLRPVDMDDASPPE